MKVGELSQQDNRTGEALDGATQNAAVRSARNRATWLPGAAAGIPEKLVAALSCGHDLVVLGDAPGPAGRITAALLAATFPLLHEAGFATASITAPLSLSVLHDAIREALTEPALPGRSDPARPLVVAIEHAENLLLPTIQRLVELAALRRDSKPVLRFLLAGTDAVWPTLRAAGLAGLEQDDTAHVRAGSGLGASLSSGRRRAVLPPAHIPREPADRPGTTATGAIQARPNSLAPGGLAPGDLASGHLAPGRLASGRLLVLVALGGIGIAAAGSIAWVLHGPQHDLPAPTSQAAFADDRLGILLQRQTAELAGHRLQAPPGDNLIETRRQIAALIPMLSPDGLRRLEAANAAVQVVMQSPEAAPAPMPPAPRTPPAPRLPAALTPAAAAPQPAPLDDTVHVTVRYDRSDAGAAVRAARLLARLRSQGMLADGPVALDHPAGHPGVAYFFTQDRSAADQLAQRLLPGGHATVDQRTAPGGMLARPGEISITIGAGDDRTRKQADPGKQT